MNEQTVQKLSEKTGQSVEQIKEMVENQGILKFKSKKEAFDWQYVDENSSANDLQNVINELVSIKGPIPSDTSVLDIFIDGRDDRLVEVDGRFYFIYD